LNERNFFLEPLSLKYLFVLAYIEICLFMGNPYQAHRPEQSFRRTQPFKHENYNTKYAMYLLLVLLSFT